ncbi:ATP-binding protein [Microbispora bryophytorum]|uniref:ATP-binding protein n=1 Tax=Microbispora bryophytorum subsp. camponoti TaxID=1677852 RepID=A0ABR8L5H6_9ACTN|nr:ATP-binding protein [Microbispora camponoti]MBD3143724.1 ATP-binding protein [Microbispora camponoti]
MRGPRDSTDMAALIPLRRRPDGAMPGERHSASPDDAADTAEDGVPDVRRASWVLPTAPSSTSRARRLVRATLRDWAGSVDGETPEVAELLVSELIANVLRHGRGEPVLTLLLQDGVLRCEVEDEARVPVRVRDTSPDEEESGRGLLIVESLSRSWGVCPTSRGKAVWFELAVRC